MSRDQHWLLTLRAGSGRVWRLTSPPQPVTITGDAPGIIRGTTNELSVTSAVPIEELTP